MKSKKSKIEQYIIDRVKEARISLGYSQEDIARIIDVSRGFVGQIESYHSISKYSIDQLNTIAIELELSLHDLFPESPIPEPKKRSK